MKFAQVLTMQSALKNILCRNSGEIRVTIYEGNHEIAAN